MEWVRVDERLPDKLDHGKKYLIRGKIGWFSVAVWDAHIGRFCNDVNSYKSTTHWQLITPPEDI